MTTRALIFSTAYLPLVGGAEVAMKEITDRLPEWQFDLVCARIRPGLPSTEKIGNITVHRVGLGRPIDKFLLPFLGPLAALQATNYRLPTLVWSLLASYGGFAALVYTWLRPKSRMLLTLQEGDPLEHYDTRAGIFKGLHRRVFRRANAVQAISKFLGDWAVKMGFQGTPDIIPNGVHVAKFRTPVPSDERERVRQSFGFSSDDTVIVTTSRLSLKNGLDDLILSLNHLPVQYKLLIVGEGEDRAKLGDVAKDHDLSGRVIFAGHRSHDDLPAILSSSDIFCRPSLSEGLGNSFLEAMAAGLPIIGTPVGGIPDFLKDGQTGVFCRVRDPNSIARAVLQLQTDKEMRERVIRQGEALVMEHYDWDIIAKNMGKLLSSLV